MSRIVAHPTILGRNVAGREDIETLSIIAESMSAMTQDR
jgi:hypothetical protein